MTQVIIDDVTPRSQIISLANQSVFNTNWTADVATDIKVYARAAGVQADDKTQIVSQSLYNVAFIGAQRTVRVTFLTPRDAGDIITITRDTPPDRKNLYTNSNFLPSMLNQDFGILTLIDQQDKMYGQNVCPSYNISDFIDKDRDIKLPILMPGYGWRMSSDGLKIEPVAIPDGGFSPNTSSFVTVSDERSNMPNSFPLSELGNALSSGMGIPAGTTAQRVIPSAPNIGLRFNTDIQSIEAYIGGQWVIIPTSTTGAFLPLSGGTMAGDINMNSNNITDLPLPTASDNPATKGYVDGLVLNIISACNYATTANLAGYTYNNGASGVGATLTSPSNAAFTADGATPALNDRIFVSFQTDQAENGVYVLTQTGNLSNPAILTRASDYNNASQMHAGDEVRVVGGNTLAGSKWMMTQTSPITVGTTPITWLEVSVPDNVFVTLATNQTITGNKTFTGEVAVPTPVASVEAANKGYVDSKGLKSMQVFTASGTWTKPAGINKVVVEVLGGGGGGGGVAVNTSQPSAASGGGGGAYARKLIDVSAINFVTVAVGAGGSGGLAGANTGSSGGTSSFGTYVTSTGGSGGNTSGPSATGVAVVSGGAPGSASGGDLNCRGHTGGPGYMIVVSSRGSGWGGGGAASYFSGSYTDRMVSTSGASISGSSAPAEAYGAGGGGAASYNATTNQPGGDGMSGIVIVWEYA